MPLFLMISVYFAWYSDNVINSRIPLFLIMLLCLFRMVFYHCDWVSFLNTQTHTHKDDHSYNLQPGNFCAGLLHISHSILNQSDWVSLLNTHAHTHTHKHMIIYTNMQAGSFCAACYLGSHRHTQYIHMHIHI